MLFRTSEGTQQKIISLIGGAPKISIGSKRKRNVSSNGGAAASTPNYWHASFIEAGGNILETWAVDADVAPVAPLTEIRPEVIPDILYAVDGKAINDFVQLLDIDLGKTNYGADDSDGTTTERTLAVDDTHYYWAKFTDVNNGDLAVEIQAVTTSKPDVTTAPSGEIWRILWEVKATSETYTGDGATVPRTGTKYTIVQKNEGLFDFSQPVLQMWAKLTAGTIGSLTGDIYDNRSAAGDPISTDVVILTPELSRGTLPTDKVFAGEIIDGSTYKIYPSSTY